MTSTETVAVQTPCSETISTHDVRGTAFGRKPDVAALQAVSSCGRSRVAESRACNTERSRAFGLEAVQATRGTDGS